MDEDTVSVDTLNGFIKTPQITDRIGDTRGWYVYGLTALGMKRLRLTRDADEKMISFLLKLYPEGGVE